MNVQAVHAWQEEHALTRSMLMNVNVWKEELVTTVKEVSNGSLCNNKCLLSVLILCFLESYHYYYFFIIILLLFISLS